MFTLLALLKLLCWRRLLHRRRDNTLTLWLLLRLPLNGYLPGRLGIARRTLQHDRGRSR